MTPTAIRNVSGKPVEVLRFLDDEARIEAARIAEAARATVYHSVSLHRAIRFVGAPATSRSGE